MEKHRNVCGSARDKIHSKSSLSIRGDLSTPGVHDFSCLSCVHLRLIVPSFYLFIFPSCSELVRNLYIFCETCLFLDNRVKKAENNDRIAKEN